MTSKTAKTKPLRFRGVGFRSIDLAPIPAGKQIRLETSSGSVWYIVKIDGAVATERHVTGILVQTNSKGFTRVKTSPGSTSVERNIYVGHAVNFPDNGNTGTVTKITVQR